MRWFFFSWVSYRDEILIRLFCALIIFHYIIHSSQLFSSENLLGKSPNQIQISPAFFIKRPLGFTLKAYFKRKETRCLKDLKEMYATYFTVLSFSCVKYICCLLAQLYHICCLLAQLYQLYQLYYIICASTDAIHSLM